MSDYLEVTATATAPWGDVSTHYVGSLPAWAWEDKGARAAWTKARRPMVLDEIGTTGGPGWRVTFTATATED